ncbi:MAG: protein kinase [Sandaracinaceae bacterium]
MSLAMDSSLPTGTVIGGRFEVLRLRGRGGMGSVYEAEDRTLSRPVALKLLSVASREAQARFATEAHAASRISSRYAAGIFDFGEDPDHGHYMVMELLDGASLDELLEERCLSPGEAAAVGADIAEALHAAHHAGVVHRDLKPGNVMLLDAGGVKVVDFGIARVVRPHGTHQPFETKPDVIIGTPAYMSPEAVRGDEVGPASDLYALGVLLFEMVTGHVPFFDPVPASLLVKHLEETPPRLSEVCPGVTLPEGFEGLVMALLEKDVAMRPRSAEEVATTLRGMSGASGAIRLAPETRATAGAHTAFVPAVHAGSGSRAWMWGVGLGATALGVLLAALALILLPRERPEVVARPLPPATDPAPHPVSAPSVEPAAQAAPEETLLVAAEPVVARLSVLVVPRSARVSIDGEAAEDVTSVSPGEHVVEARAAGYRTERRVVDVDGDRSVEITLQRSARGRAPSREHGLPAKMREW